jgi:hypothetical protein
MSAVQAAASHRAAGNSRFSSGDFDGAITEYTQALRALLPGSSSSSSSSSGPSPSSIPPPASAAARRVCAGEEAEKEDVESAVSGLDADSRREAVTCLVNRAQSHAKAGRAAQAAVDCSAALAIDGANVKALYRRALCYEAMGKLREALTDASRALQVDKSNSAAADLVRKLRAVASGASVSGHGPGAGSGAGTGASSSTSSGSAADGGIPAAPGLLTLADSIDLLRRTAGGSLPRAEFERCARSLAAVLVASSPVRAFLGEDGPRLLLSAALPLAASAGLSLTPSFNLLISLSGRVSEEFAQAWHKDWDAERRRQNLALADMVPAQTKLCEALASPVAEHVLPLVSSGADGAPLPLVSAAVRVGASLLAASYACVRPQVQAQTLDRIRQWKAIKEGTLTTTAPLPGPLHSALRAWAGHVTRSLNSLGPLSDKTPAAALAQLAVQAVGHLAECEDAVNIFDRSSTLTAAAVLAASDLPDVRSTASASLSKALTILRDAHPRGHAEMGRDKMKALLMRMVVPCVRDLAESLPPMPEKEGGDGAKGAGAGAKGAGADSGRPEIFRVPDALPDWRPRDDTTRATALLYVALLTERDVGLWLAEQPGVLPAVVITCASTDGGAQAAGADVIATICSDETGRSLLTTLPQRIVCADPSYATRLDIMPLLQRLATSNAQTVRASAAVTLAKLTAPSKSFTAPEGKQGSEEMVGSVLDLLKAAAGLRIGADGKTASAAGAGAGAGGAGNDEEEEEEGDAEFDEDDEEARAEGLLPPKPASTAVSLVSSAPSSRAAADPLFPSFRHMVAAVKAGWGKGAAPSSGIGTNSSSFGTPEQMDKATAAVSAVDLEGAARAIEALAVLSVHTATKSRLVKEDCVRPLMAIGASLVAHVELTRAMVLAARNGENDADAAELGAGRHVVSGRGGIIDVGKVSATARSLATRAPLRPTLYGLAHVLYSLVTSRQRMQEAKLAEMDVDLDQWRELQRLATPPGADPNAGQEHDPPSEVEARTRELLRADVLHLIAGLAEAARGLPDIGEEEGSESKGSKGGKGDAGQKDLKLSQTAPDGRPLPPPVANTAKHGAATRELLSLFLLQASEWLWARGILVQAGAIPLLIDLADAGRNVVMPGQESVSASVAASGSTAPLNTPQGALSAAQALARIFITTNPALIPRNYTHDSVTPLLRLARDSSTSLGQFEAGMALTNIGSTGPEAREVMIRRGALGALEFLQFASHVMVRRCGTEALANLATSERGVRLITRSRLALWLAFARSYQAPGAPIKTGSEESGKKKKKKDPRLAAITVAAKRGKGMGGGGEGGAERGVASNAAGPADASEEDGAPQESGDGVVDDDDDDRDTPTAMAAAGGLAMAVSDSLSGVETEEQAKRALETAKLLVRGGTVTTMCELLLSGHPGLVHRAVVVLEALASYPVGAAALLTPLAKMDAFGDDGDNDKEEEEDDGSRPANPFAAAAKGVNAFFLLHLLSQGRDLAAMAGVLKVGGASRGSGGASDVDSSDIPEQVLRLAGSAARTALTHGRDDLEDAAREYGAEVKAARKKAAAARKAAKPSSAGGDGGSGAGAGAGSGEALTPSPSSQDFPEPTNVDDVDDVSAWRVAALSPEWPAEGIVNKLLTEDEDD